VRGPGDRARPDADTLYCIASVSKAVTAFAVLLLVDEGKVALDAPASRYLPGLPWSWRPVTVRQFLCHVSGVPRGLMQPTFEEALERAAYRQAAPPGERTQYNNFNYAVAGKLIEAVSGRSYAGFVGERVFGPLGMSRSRVGRGSAGNQASGFKRGPGGLFAPPLWPEAGPHYAPSGMIYASLNDMTAFVGAVSAGRLLLPKTAAELTRPYGPAMRGTPGGWFAKVAGGLPYDEKLGRVSGYSTDAEFNPRGDAIVMMWNLQTSRDNSIAVRSDVRQALLGVGPPAPGSPSASVLYEHDG
jgi:CubicO group peptidase (beta-lactamase class C family)